MTTSEITQWLQQPSTTVDALDLQQMLHDFPFFTPLRYMDAAGQAKAQSFAPASLNSARLYIGNWLLFHQLMQEAVVPPVVASEAQTKEETSAPEISISMHEPKNEQASGSNEAPLIQPIFTEDYFLHQGILVDENIPAEIDHPVMKDSTEPDPKSLMVVMSFAEWLMHFRTKTQKEKEDEDDRKAVKTMWQREKLAAALEEEEDEIPENVFEMAVNSISREDGLASESLAEILTKQGKKDQAIEMYKKLSLRNPQKSAYFAQQIAQIQKSSDL